MNDWIKAAREYLSATEKLVGDGRDAPTVAMLALLMRLSQHLSQPATPEPEKKPAIRRKPKSDSK